MSEGNMTLEGMADALQNASDEIKTFLQYTENESAAKYIEHYIEKHQLGLIRDELKGVFHAGYMFRVRQERMGKFD